MPGNNPRPSEAFVVAYKFMELETQRDIFPQNRLNSASSRITEYERPADLFGGLNSHIHDEQPKKQNIPTW